MPIDLTSLLEAELASRLLVPPDEACDHKFGEWTKRAPDHSPVRWQAVCSKCKCRETRWADPMAINN